MNAPAIDALMSRRQRLLGPTYGLFYREPVHLVRAQGVWMFDPQERPYLDVYNNVPVVGHGHPRVVEALVGQAKRLNTHTRYLTDSPLELSETLLKTLPRNRAHDLYLHRQRGQRSCDPNGAAGDGRAGDHCQRARLSR